MIRKNEKGALLVEVIAVLGLIALITPILFGQIQRRNEDIVDAQHASELRAVKDAFSAYLLANEEAFALECGLCTPTGEEAGEDVRCLEYISVADEQCETEANVGQELDDKKYLPADFPVGDYTFKLYGKTIAAPNNKYRPVVYGIAYRNTPEPKFGRASKIAAMVGIEGGVVQEAGTIKGMQGGPAFR